MSSPHSDLGLNIAILKALFQLEQDAILVFDLTGKVVFTNDSLKKLAPLESVVKKTPHYKDISAFLITRLKDKNIKDIEKTFGTFPNNQKFEVMLHCHRYTTYKLIALPIEEDGKSLGCIWRMSDVSELHESDRKLGEQQTKYSQLFENMINAFSLHKIETNKAGKPIDYVFVEINTPFVKMMGIPKEEIIGKKVTELIPGIEKDSTDWIGIYGEVSLTGKSMRIENYSEALKKWFNITAYSPEKGYFVTIFEDITERKNNEFALAASEAKKRAIFDQSFQFMGLLDLEGKLLEVNNTALGFINSSAEDVQGKYFWDTPWWNFSQEVMDKVKESVKIVAKGGFVRTETVHRAQDMTNHNIDFTLKPIRDSRGAIAYLIAEGRDITDRKLMEQNLNNILNRDEAILDSIGDAVFAIDSSGKILIFNNSASEITGVLKSDAIEKNYTEIVQFVTEKDGKPANSFMNEAFELKKITASPQKVLILKKNGDRIPVSPTAAPVINSLGDTIGCVVVFRDVTEERNIDKAKSEFVMIASHQLRTPLTIIKWSLESILSSNLSNLTATQSERINESYSATTRMADLVDSLLNASRLEVDSIQIIPEKVVLEPLIKAIIKDFSPAISQRGITVTESYDPTMKTLNADKKLLGIIVGNLISNAIKYSRTSGKVYISIKKQSGKFQFKIADNGIGIPKEQQSKVFDKLFRAENAVHVDPSGTGLGLYIAKSVITKAGGDIWFESTESGTTFYVSFPESGMKSFSGSKKLI